MDSFERLQKHKNWQAMGARASKEKGQGSLVVMIVLGGSKRETYSRPVSAQEVMLRHPQHVLTRRTVLRSYTIVSPETVLLPGNKYYLVQRCTVKWLLDDHMDLAKISSSSSNSVIDPLNLGSDATTFTNGIRKIMCDSIIARPWQSPLKSSLKSSLNSSFGITSSENNPRSRRSSPKVGDEHMWEGQIPDMGIYIFSPVKDETMEDQKREKLDHAYGSSGSLEVSGHDTSTIPLLQQPLLPKVQTDDAVKEKSSPLLSRSASMQGKLSSQQEALGCKLLSQSPGLVANNVENALQIEEGAPHYRRCLSLPEQAVALKNKHLFELLKYPDVNVTELVEGTQQCVLPFALKMDIEVYESNKENNPGLPVVERVEVHDCIGVMPQEEGRSALDDVLHLHQDDKKQHKESQAHKIQESHSHVDQGEFIIESIYNIAQAYNDDKRQVDTTFSENTQIAELGLPKPTCDDEATKASQQRNEGSTFSESLLPNIMSADLESVEEDQWKEGCAYIPPERNFDQSTSSLMLSFNGKSGLLCQSGEEEALVPVCPTHDNKAIGVDGSIKKKLCKDLNEQMVPTFGDVPLRQSPKLIDSGIRHGEKNMLSSLLSLSSSSSSSSLSMRQPLSLLMRRDQPQTSMPNMPSFSYLQPQQGNNYAKAQRNLAILGFSFIGRDRVTIYDQAMAHSRAHLGKHWKVASSKRLSLEEQEHEEVHPSNQQREEKEACQSFSFAPRSPTISHGKSLHVKIRRSLLQPLKKPLSPIVESFPELSPASLSPLSDCSSS